MSFEKFQDGHCGGHPGYQNGMILAILNLCVTVMPPIKFCLNRTYGLGEDVIGRISRWPPWRPSWISKRNDFSNFKSLCHCDASHQVSAQSDLQFGRCRLKNFKMAAMGYQNRTILAILNLHVATMPPTKFQLNPTYYLYGWTDNRPWSKLTWSKAPRELIRKISVFFNALFQAIFIRLLSINLNDPNRQLSISLATTCLYPASILRKSTSGRLRPVSYPDGPMTARYRFT